MERTRDLMDRATRDSLVEGYHALIPALTLPDADDRHVLAAAIVGRCDVIVTQNLADFPAEALDPFGRVSSRSFERESSVQLCFESANRRHQIIE